MTSSLVGSEMCIRDSYSGAGGPAEMFSEMERSYRAANVALPRNFVRAYRAVSYTHLTLPTICSV
eukprot:8441760-Prorocentrum_lima.AAC.1